MGTGPERLTHADHKIALAMPEMLDEVRALSDAQPHFTTA